MKILYLIDTLEGYGAEKSIVNIALHLQKINTVFVHLYSGEKLKPLLENKGIDVYSLNLESVYLFKEAYKVLIPIVEKERPDIIHSTLFRADMVARRLKTVYPEILLVGSLVSNSYSKRRYSRLSILSAFKLFSTQLRDRMTSGKVDYFICNSKAIMESNITALKIPEEKVEIIYRGRYVFNSLTQENSSGLLRKEFKAHNKKVFLNVGRLERGKGQLDLVNAFANLLKTKRDILLIISGEGSLRPRLTKRIEELGLEKDVLLLGYRDDISELLFFADFFVFPTYFEGLPGALIEAMIAKRPTIVSNIEENKECLPEGSSLFFEPGRVDELSDKMEEALYIEDWEQRTAKAYCFAQKNFDIKLVSKKYETFYQNILKN